MTGRRWILLTFATVVAVIAMDFTVAYALDPYGVLRNPSGRKLAVYFAERKAKFLLSKRYVPANFDGLIIGPSSGINWDASGIAGAKIYNESLAGANATEEQIVVNQTLPHGHYKLAIFVLWQSMTADHDVKEGLGTTSTAEALGSFHLYVHEAARVLLRAHRRFGKSDTAPNGQVVVSVPKHLQAYTLQPSQFQFDPVSLRQYIEMVQALRNQGAQIVYVAPPIYGPCFDLDKQSYQSYDERVLKRLPPAPVIDFDAPEYTALRNDPANFIDCFHVEPEGAAKVVALLNTLVPQAIAAGK